MKASSPPIPSRRPRRYARWRAATLASVYLLMGIHVAHWKMSGKTMAPLELNELMYGLERGIVTAGFIFMCLATVTVLVFGRFFCSWGCHILAVEDLCHWLLSRVKIRPRPIRSRWMLLVPPAAMFYMFIWPQLKRMYHEQGLPDFHFAGDEEGWASFVTTDLTRNMPGPWIGILTFAVCGFAMIYVLGSRSFCTYVCPYGALFSLADRLSPGKIVARDGCQACGTCTAACQSHVRVHEELARYGRVVDPGCLKDLDCISVCPHGAVGYGFDLPGIIRPLRRGRIRRFFGFSPGEELLLIATLFLSVLVFRGLYGVVPFLLSLAVSALIAYALILGLRLWRRTYVRQSGWLLKSAGQLTGAGKGVMALCVITACFVVHSAFIRYHEFRGQRAFDTALAEAKSSAEGEFPSVTIAAALGHLETCERWGLIDPPYLDSALARLHVLADRPDRAESYLRRMLRTDADDTDARLRLAELLHRGERPGESLDVLRPLLDSEPAPGVDPRGDPFRALAFELAGRIHTQQGHPDAALDAYRSAWERDERRLPARLAAAEILASGSRFEEAVEILAPALSQPSPSAVLHYNIALYLGRLGRQDEAIRHYLDAVAIDPADAEIHNNLGRVLARRGQAEEAEHHLRRAIELRPDYAHPHFNLSRLLFERGEFPEAERHLRRAAELDPRYAELLRGK